MIEQVKEAMGRLHERHHSMLGALMIYLHSTTQTPAERVAVVNHAIDAAFNLAMLMTPESQRDVTKAELVRRVASCDTDVYPPIEELKENQAIHGLFTHGLNMMAEDTQLMTLLGALLMARKTVNDTKH